MIMKRFLTFFLLLSGGLAGLLNAQDTFSICAVDTATGEVGSAGASCINGSIIISDVHPGVGVAHTQALYVSSNQNLARTLMAAGLSPQEIIDSVVAADLASAFRQYGAVDLSGDSSRSAGFTGGNCTSWAGHLVGPNYAIQGNILLGPEILDSIEAGFLNTPGSLCDKLMGALQGANVPGADTRCLSDGKSSLSAFIRVAKPGDAIDSLWLDLNVNSTPAGVEPIDSLQVLFDETKYPAGIGEKSLRPDFRIWQDPFDRMIHFKSYSGISKPFQLRIIDVNGKTMDERTIFSAHQAFEFNSPAGVYLVVLDKGNDALGIRKLLVR